MGGSVRGAPLHVLRWDWRRHPPAAVRVLCGRVSPVCWRPPDTDSLAGPARGNWCPARPHGGPPTVAAAAAIPTGGDRRCGTARHGVAWPRRCRQRWRRWHVAGAAGGKGPAAAAAAAACRGAAPPPPTVRSWGAGVRRRRLGGGRRHARRRRRRRPPPPGALPSRQPRRRARRRQRLAPRRPRGAARARRGARRHRRGVSDAGAAGRVGRRRLLRGGGGPLGATGRRGAAADGAARRSPPPPPCAAAPACAGASRQGWRREGRARSGRRGPTVVGTAPVASVGQRLTWINVQPSGWWPFFVFAFPYVAPQSATDGGRGGGGTGGDRGEGRGGADGRLPSDGDPAVVGARLVLPMACTGTRGRARRARGGTEPAHVGRGGDVAAWASPGGPTAKAKNRDLVRFSTVPTSQWRSRGGGQDAGSTPRPVGGANPFANSPPCPLGGDPPWVPGTAEWWVVSRCMLPSGPHLHQRAALTKRATVVAAASPVV